jgi:hypothetical protein
MRTNALIFLPRSQKRALPLILGLCAASFGLSAHGQSFDSPVTADYPHDGVELGQGWSATLRQKTNAICVAFTDVKDLAQDKSLSITSTDDKSSLSNQLQISAELQVKAMIGSASFKTDFVKSVELKDEYSNFSVLAIVNNGAEYAAPDSTGKLDLKPEFVTLAKTNLTEFLNQCGDTFVSARYGGAELDALITVEDHSIDQHQALKMAIEGSGWGVTASASYNTAMTSASASHKLTIKYRQSGGSGDPLPIDQPTLNTAIEKLAAAASTAGEYFQIELTRYDSLASWPASPQNLTTTSFGEVAARYGQLTSLHDELESIKKDPSQWIIDRGVTIQSIKALEDQIDAHTISLQKSAHDCLDPKGGACAIDPGDDVSDYTYRILMPAAKGSFPEDVAIPKAMADLDAKQVDLDNAIAARNNMPSSIIGRVYQQMYDQRIIPPKQAAVTQAKAYLASLQATYPSALKQAIGKQWISDVVSDRCAPDRMTIDCIDNAETDAWIARIVTQ